MASLKDIQTQQGAKLAPDNIPLQFGNLLAEYHAALNEAALLDRSHEGRIVITGADRFEVVQRVSTNDVLNIPENAGRATVFTTATARILDRIEVYNRGDHALVLTEPGRGLAVKNYLQRQIFFNDDAQVKDITGESAQFGLHGAQADAVANAFGVATADMDALQAAEVTIAEKRVYIIRRKPLSSTYWTVIVPSGADAGAVWQALSAHETVTPAGSLTFNVVRIRSGRPAVGRELTQNYIPLEVGLWDEVSFTKGCYTGQEIIARMESRARMAKVMVRVRLSEHVDTPASLAHNGKTVGNVTSSVKAPDGEI
ncbi:MAG: hypothetical protein AAF787_18160, partial [Chloroflexota bacterium]